MGFINNYSPLRYPGGKAATAGFFANILSINNIGNDGIYCEPFAGGAGVALTLLLNGRIEFIVINDFDPCIAAFWSSFLYDPKRFIDKILECDISMDSWFYHRYIYNNADSMDLNNADQRFVLGFSTFFLNRSNRAGILPKAGPIGGKYQKGKYRLDARFKKDVLISRMKKISIMKDRIIFTSHDARDFIANIKLQGFPKEKLFMYLDPPYYHKGKELYLNFYTHDDHLCLASEIIGYNYCKWIMTYDDCLEIRKIYNCQEIIMCQFDIKYTMQKVRSSNELLIIPKSTKYIA
jgi:DNA adenine methylase